MKRLLLVLAMTALSLAGASYFVVAPDLLSGRDQNGGRSTSFDQSGKRISQQRPAMALCVPVKRRMRMKQTRKLEQGLSRLEQLLKQDTRS